ncbi:hypothetical protein RIF29_17572 [Crotalaria pallida]|uniref:Uncharacterized protein n=1 Tax=Crotalaria pallida TaxID=3830 RepID=A0AAN9FP96_CROPI
MARNRTIHIQLYESRRRKNPRNKSFHTASCFFTQNHHLRNLLTESRDLKLKGITFYQDFDITCQQNWSELRPDSCPQLCSIAVSAPSFSSFSLTHSLVTQTPIPDHHTNTTTTTTF